MQLVSICPDFPALDDLHIITANSCKKDLAHIHQPSPTIPLFVVNSFISSRQFLVLNDLRVARPVLRTIRKDICIAPPHRFDRASALLPEVELVAPSHRYSNPTVTRPVPQPSSLPGTLRTEKRGENIVTPQETIGRHTTSHIPSQAPKHFPY